MKQTLYGVLFRDGTFEELPNVTSAGISGDDLVCYDGEDQIVARFADINTVFGKADLLSHMATAFLRTASEAVEQSPLGD